MIKIQIKSIYGGILFEYEKENNTIKETLLKAIESGANLRGVNLRRASLSDADLSSANLSSANLSDADLSGANLSGAYLRGVNLRRARLSDANLRGVNLSDADLSGAYLSDADLSGAYLSDADLSGAKLSDANLSSANLRRVNLRRANLSGANLRGVNLSVTTFGITINCPEEGSFIAFKKCRGSIIKLLIPEDAKRSSATTYKCRASKAKTLEIEGGLDEIASDYDPSFIYRVGETVEVKNFDEDRWNECSTGIHFFMSREMAKQYN